MVQTLLFVAFWMMAVPASSLRMATTITGEKLFERPRAFIEHRYPDTLLEYLVGCKVCVLHWVVLGFALSFWKQWVFLADSMGLDSAWTTLLVGMVFWFTAVQIALFIDHKMIQ